MPYRPPGSKPSAIAGCHLAKARDALRMRAVLPSEMTQDYNPYMSVARLSGYSVLLICNRHLLTHSYPPGWRAIAETPHFAVLQADK